MTQIVKVEANATVSRDLELKLLGPMAKMTPRTYLVIVSTSKKVSIPSTIRLLEL